jgi:hypothetical protein
MTILCYFCQDCHSLFWSPLETDFYISLLVFSSVFIKVAVFFPQWRHRFSHNPSATNFADTIFHHKLKWPDIVNVPVVDEENKAEEIAFLRESARASGWATGKAGRNGRKTTLETSLPSRLSFHCTTHKSTHLSSVYSVCF